MKIMVNRGIDKFRLSEEFQEKHPEIEEWQLYERDNLDLIKTFEEFGWDKVVANQFIRIEVVELDDETVTDWTIKEDDGLEVLIFVQNGKLHFSYS